MATKTPKSSTVKTKTATSTTTAPKVSRVRKAEATETGGQVMRELIAMRAYERYVARGYTHGHDVEDWLSAEREILQSQ